MLSHAVLCAAARGGAAAGLWRRAPVYDPKIPTIKQVLGHDYGEKITTPEEIPIYLRALNQAAPDRTRLTEYARIVGRTARSGCS